MRKLKAKKHRQLNEDRRCRLLPLRYKHLVPMMKAAWEDAFTEDRNLKGWAAEGLIPFTRNEYWKLHLANKAKLMLRQAAAGAQVTSTAPASVSPRDSTQGPQSSNPSPVDDRPSTRQSRVSGPLPNL